MSENPLLALKALGQHIWLDNLSRTLLREGGLQRLIDEDGVDGVTSNPAIFEKAIAGSPYYRDDLKRLRGAGLGAEACYESLVIADIQVACVLLQPVYAASGGETGYVSLEVSPALAQDTDATIAAAHRLRQAVGCANALIKVPATPAGIGAFEQLTAAGLRVNVMLIFSLAQYEVVAQAYLRGAQAWLDGGGHPEQLRGGQHLPEPCRYRGRPAPRYMAFRHGRGAAVAMKESFLCAVANGLMRPARTQSNGNEHQSSTDFAACLLRAAGPNPIS